METTNQTVEKIVRQISEGRFKEVFTWELKTHYLQVGMRLRQEGLFDRQVETFIKKAIQ